MNTASKGTTVYCMRCAKPCNEESWEGVIYFRCPDGHGVQIAIPDAPVKQGEK